MRASCLTMSISFKGLLINFGGGGMIKKYLRELLSYSQHIVNEIK